VFVGVSGSGVISRTHGSGLIFLFMLNGPVHRCTVVTVLSHLICGSFIQPLAMELPISQSVMDSAKIFTVCTVCNVQIDYFRNLCRNTDLVSR